MKGVKLFFVILLMSFVSLGQVFAQQTWEKQVFVTGYFTLNGEYVQNLSSFNEIKNNNKGIDIAEASILTMIKPLEKLKINAVITYRPRLILNGIIAELSGEWRFRRGLSFKAGRFLLPIHPVNLEYYAPLNVGITLPIFVTNHALFPLNINGIDVNGKIDISDNYSMNYNLIGGQYSKISRSEEGILGFFGRDGVYLSYNIKQIENNISQLNQSEKGVYPQYWGGAARLSFDLGSYIKLATSIFYSDEKATKQPNENTFYKTRVKFLSYGTNFSFKYNNYSLKTSLWFNEESPEDNSHFDSYDVIIYNGEMTYTFADKITPYAKYEKILGRMKDWVRIIGGINFRPYYDMTFKLEYLRYFQDYVDNFNIFQFSLVYAF